MMIRKIMVLSLVLAAGLCAGCNNDMKAKYPKWPEWGWWKQPAESKDSAKSKDTDKAKSEEETKPQRRTAKTRTSDWGPRSAPQEEPVSRREILVVDDHRERIWPEVAKLRDTDGLSPTERKVLMENAVKSLPRWYKNMPVKAPNTKSDNWVYVVIWDFMPEAEYVAYVNNWQKIATRDRLPFPRNLTRRKLLKFICDVQDGRITPLPIENTNNNR